MGRPLLCTEYMARGNNSTFTENLQVMKELDVAASSWGLVSGKSNMIYSWDSWVKHYTNEPAVWFHDIFRPDGTPFSTAEVHLISNLCTRESDVGASSFRPAANGLMEARKLIPLPAEAPARNLRYEPSFKHCLKKAVVGFLNDASFAVTRNFELVWQPDGLRQANAHVYEHKLGSGVDCVETFGKYRR